jgi:histidinol phosphatase-like PHP family hydrolase
MANYCCSLGYEYLGICDHSKTAVYAQGLSIEKVLEQQEEIEKLNASFENFRILKGIESDILSDGSLDYPDEILEQLDLVVASIHSNLSMTEEKSMSRLLSAIENPYTTILGHMTGRLLLLRQGYPVNHRKIIDACVANGVAIDAGIRYVTGEQDQIKFGITLKNVGPTMRFKGDGLATQINYVSTGGKATLEQRSQAFEMPSLLAIGGSYDFIFNKSNINI